MSGKHTWYTFGSSVQGATHVRNHVPNQDAIEWLASYERQHEFVLVAVADGHGNPRYFRSAIGARFAVQVARTLLEQFGRHYGQATDLTVVEQMVEQQLAHLLVRQWNDTVDVHLAAVPFSPAELASLDAPFRPKLAANPRLAYGSTLASTLITGTFILYMQLGDGDIVTVNTDGVVSRAPLVVDPQLSGDVTTSLCLPSAWRYVRTYLQPLVAHPPAMIMLATDGYSNSFVKEDGFLAAAQDIFDMIEPQGREGICTLRKYLPRWLTATSAQGSGDDISVGIIYRIVR